MWNDMEQVLAIDVVHDAEILMNELAEDEPLAFEDQTSDTTDTLIIDEEPAMHQFYYQLSLCQCKNTAVNQCQL